MVLWALVALGYEFLRNRKITASSVFLVFSYFFVVFVLSFISTNLFPIFGDEFLYDSCGLNISKFIGEGIYWNFPDVACQISPNNNFAKLVGYIYYILGKSYYNLVGLNAFVLFVGVDFLLLAFRILPTQRDILNRMILFCPPILYLAIRPAKEGFISFIICLAFFSVSLRKRIVGVVAAIVVLSLFYLFRWQYAAVYLCSLLILAIWSLWTHFSNSVKIGVLVFVMISSIVYWFEWRPQVLHYPYTTIISPDIVAEHATTPNGAFIYKLMLYKNGESSLHMWNIFVAHLGGFFTPHPLRFVKEWMRDRQFDYPVFEEFIFTSFWFYSLLPIFFLYLRDLFVRRIRNLHLVPKAEAFNFIFICMLFSMACFSLFFQAPQLFRYKIPLNIYVFGVTMIYVQMHAIEGVLQELKRLKSWLALYLFILASYSIFYLAI